MNHQATFGPAADLPAPLRPLLDLARNLRWTWEPGAVELFRRLDPDQWNPQRHNPLALLARLSPTRLESLARDPGYVAELDRVAGGLRRYLDEGAGAAPRTAYFSAEFGMHESLPLYAGGLGVLAGDHLKAASDLDLPLVAVGLAYRRGYLRQEIDGEGWQQEGELRNDFDALPMALLHGDDGAPLEVTVPLPGRELRARIRRVLVGRVPLYLLDADLPENDPADREVTDRLYGGDDDMRIRQELLLGVGGLRALQALGLDPAVRHLNEGHSAFLVLELMRRELAAEPGLSPDEALARARAGNVFTTHTPVAAGHDVFPAEQVRPYLEALAAEGGPAAGAMLALGVPDASESHLFNMTVLALRGARFANGVSELHGAVSRRMLNRLWPDRAEDEVPIGHVTNGVHLPSWTDPALARLLEDSGDDGPDPEALWRVHEEGRARLVSTARSRTVRRLCRLGAGKDELIEAMGLLDPSALTIGFARRFAEYKRADLILGDPERLARLLNDPARPVQILFAGKAHPRNAPGKEMIRRIVQLSGSEPFRGRILLVENYDMSLSRTMVQGVDLWLNNPRRPLEASGTSGMKAAANGAPNLSVLDGWWCEGFHGDNGWAIGEDRDIDDPAEQDRIDRESLFSLLEDEIVPMFYDRDARGVPRRWVEVMRRAIAGVRPDFGTARMVGDYDRNYYRPCAEGRDG